MRWVLLIAMLAGLSACGVGPKIHYVTLVPDRSGNAALADYHGRPLQVGQVQLPGDLDRSALVILGPGTNVTVSDRYNWVSPLRQSIQRVLTADLRARLGESRVLGPSDAAPVGGARTLLLTVERFSADSSGQVVLATDWVLGHGNPPKPGPLHHAHIVENAGSTAGPAVAAAMSKALGRLADEVAGAV